MNHSVCFVDLIASMHAVIFGVVLILVTSRFSLGEDTVLFSNSWAVEIRGGVGVADRIARRHGFINKGQVSLSMKRPPLIWAH